MLITTLFFIAGYMIIALEHVVKINKAATALFIGVALWIIVAYSGVNFSETLIQLKEHFEEISEILFFLLGAMTIVELIDIHNGFEIILRVIKTRSMLVLLWVLCLLTFFLSAVLDNLTTTIVMMAILRKFFKSKLDLWYFAGFIIIAANAGGAWSPIGDVTTIMLWNGGQVSTNTIITEVFLPSLVCLLVPLLIASYNYKGRTIEAEVPTPPTTHQISPGESNFILILGVGLLLMVPVFKAITHLPPFLGMLFSLCLLWLITEILHKNKPIELKHHLSVAYTVQKIDTPSILFFLGILLAVAAIQTNGSLEFMGSALETAFHDFHITNTLLGLLSSLIDNVPLVAGAMGMYSMETFPQNHEFWTFLAYCAGTGGSVLVIGSAAGVAAMGILKIDFLWYLRHIAWLALLGYFSGILVFILIN
ncbi:sodium:proton antiporter NhaD [Arenibacter sp. ARW7G5Y1]|uniref:sodium:proton antiporter NhaD n=1 Tax=Arenibacter sp. ARW7G5Y1 TaxID=2135619 RepID=UPI000D75DF38|nr:sodium:proton antiporter NhaD [Arenibacter sp. ARW7G5Y1]PXX28403.1 sodium/proton antiporter (NhaD family) [Arenibacter sp. ARW7G5Y1]